jgi:hypothetical protein
MTDITPESEIARLEERNAQRAEAKAKISEVRATLRARRAERTGKLCEISGCIRSTDIMYRPDVAALSPAAGSGAEPSRSVRAERIFGRASLKDESWATVERYIAATLSGRQDDTVTLETAIKAAESIETDRLATGTTDAGQWNTSDVTRVHGVRIRLIKLLLGLRETQGEDRIPDTVFQERWARTAKIFKYHDEHWVKERRKNKEIPLVSLAFPDDGTSTMFELGRRVWRGVR